VITWFSMFSESFTSFFSASIRYYYRKQPPSTRINRDPITISSISAPLQRPQFPHHMTERRPLLHLGLKTAENHLAKRARIFTPSQLFLLPLNIPFNHLKCLQVVSLHRTLQRHSFQHGQSHHEDLTIVDRAYVFKLPVLDPVHLLGGKQTHGRRIFEDDLVCSFSSIDEVGVH